MIKALAGFGTALLDMARVTHELSAALGRVEAPPVVMTVAETPCVAEAPAAPEMPPAPVAAAEAVKTGGRPPVKWSPERKAIVFRDWPAGVTRATIVGSVNALPGPAVEGKSLGVQAAQWRLRRPPGYKDAKVPVARPKETDSPKAVIQSPPEEMARPAAKLIAATPPSPLPRPTFTTAKPASFTPPPRRSDKDAAAVATFIATKGVTRCPPAALEATTATIPAEGAAQLRAHTEAQNAARTAENAARIKASIARKTQAAKARLANGGRV